MKSFREIIQEGLSYSIDKEQLKKFKNLEDYKTSNKGTITSYIKDNKIIFSYDSKTGKLIVLKQGWQLMNLERGF